MKDFISNIFQEAASLRTKIAEDQALIGLIEEASKQLIQTINSDGTIYLCGNGGSACDAMHFSEELVARYKKDRRGIKSMHFLDQGALTCWSNDYEYKTIFARYAETFCSEKDLLVVFSTSGNSENVNLAVQAAKEKNCFTLGLIGKDGGKLKDLVDLAITVPEEKTERIQEIHITLVHIFCELIEEHLE